MDEGKMIKMTCIECPIGCEITVETGNEMKITGSRCVRGEKYAVQEVSDPRRVLTTTVFVEGAIRPLLPVASDGEIPKGMVKKCVRELSKIKVKAPVNYGDVIVEDVCGTGVDVIASRSMVKNEA
jgi:CxxC motif-containing protein